VDGVVLGAAPELGAAADEGAPPPPPAAGAAPAPAISSGMCVHVSFQGSGSALCFVVWLVWVWLLRGVATLADRHYFAPFGEREHDRFALLRIGVFAALHHRISRQSTDGHDKIYPLDCRLFDCASKAEKQN